MEAGETERMLGSHVWSEWHTPWSFPPFLWEPHSSCVFSSLHVHISPINHCGISYFPPLWEVSGLKEWEGLASPLLLFLGKRVAHPLKSHLLSNCLLCYEDEPDSALKLPRSAEAISCRMSLKDTCKKPTKSWYKSAFSLKCSRVSTSQGEEAGKWLTRWLLSLTLYPAHIQYPTHSSPPLATLPSSYWTLVLQLGSAKLPPRSHCVGTHHQDLF